MLIITSFKVYKRGDGGWRKRNNKESFKKSFERRWIEKFLNNWEIYIGDNDDNDKIALKLST